MKGRRGRRLRKLLGDLKERRGYSHLEEKALDRTMWRARFGRGFRLVVRQTAKLTNIVYGSPGTKPNGVTLCALGLMWPDQLKEKTRGVKRNILHNLPLAAFVKLGKATTSFVMCVRPSVWPYGTTRLPLDGFSWNFMWVFFENLSRKLKFHQNLTRITVALYEDQYTFWITSRWFSLRTGNTSKL
jgi:hypothetical protein